MDFGEVLSRAWKTIWKHKILWIFGILSSCGQGGSGGSSSGGGAQSSGGNDWTGDVPPAMQEFFFNMEQFFNQIEGWQIAGVHTERHCRQRRHTSWMTSSDSRLSMSQVLAESCWAVATNLSSAGQ